MNPTIIANEPKTKSDSTSPSMLKPARRRWTAAEKAACLARFEKSALPAGAFCKKSGLCAQTFYAWKRQARVRDGAKRPDTPGFAEVSVKTPGIEPSAKPPAMTIRIGADIRLEAAVGTDPAWLAQVLNGLRPL
jgi:transposase-like protein